MGKCYKTTTVSPFHPVTQIVRREYKGDTSFGKLVPPLSLPSYCILTVILHQLFPEINVP